ncbi:MAG TPA: penicillin-binding protein 1C [Bacteroidales bacterium]|nr:penicillin-binding protein 1C [Bacteroidales bacterium]
MKNKAKIVLFIAIAFWISIIFIFIFCLPSPLFNDPYSTVVLDKNGEILGVKISTDGQWRFPDTEQVSDKFETCIIAYEDKRFYSHPGFDPFAIFRAIRQNISSGKTVSGGSTLTMQTIRLIRKGKPRTFFEKGIELILAVRLEAGYSKKEILNLYASHAPFGGNVVGIEAAAWRYFGRSPDELSWAENAMLAVLPNSPSIINTAKNRDLLKIKRNKLLKKLLENNTITQTEYELAIDEDIPEHPLPYPMHAYHLVNRASAEFSQSRFKINTTLDLSLQKQANEIINYYNQLYYKNNINNIACLVLEVETGNTLIYVGNGDINSKIPEKAVDMITANRSTGSILKPFLYAATLSAGEILPKTLLKDIPTKMGSFSPENFEHEYAGAIPANEALARSLNIPFVYMLKDYGIMRFLYILKCLRLKSIDKDSEHYGLSLILGGAESSLWDICSAYASMARSLKHFNLFQSRYSLSDYHQANYIKSDKTEDSEINFKETGFLSAASIWFTFEAMSSLNRPGQEKQWRTFSSKQKVSWKTGTSFGFKDAWSIAVTPNYVVGIWVGNATGEGRNGITGLRVAAPVLFEILNILPNYKSWFEMPYDEMVYTSVCRESGHLAGQYCNNIDSVWIPAAGINSESCPYHRLINLDASGSYRVNSDCYPIESMQQQSWFVLPPVMEIYYRTSNAWYQSLPPFLDGCIDFTLKTGEIMELIYPSQLSRVLIPIDLKGDTLPAVFKAAHRDFDVTIYWYIDSKYMGYTKNFHEMGFTLAPGTYTLTLMDDKGNKISKKFVVINRE